VVPKVGVEIQTSKAKSQKGRDQAVQTWVRYFQCCHCLSVSVCIAYTSEKSRLLVLKRTWSRDVRQAQVWVALKLGNSWSI